MYVLLPHCESQVHVQFNSFSIIMANFIFRPDSVKPFYAFAFKVGHTIVGLHVSYNVIIIR